MLQPLAHRLQREDALAAQVAKPTSLPEIAIGSAKATVTIVESSEFISMPQT